MTSLFLFHPLLYFLTGRLSRLSKKLSISSDSPTYSDTDLVFICGQVVLIFLSEIFSSRIRLKVRFLYRNCKINPGSPPAPKGPNGTGTSLVTQIGRASCRTSADVT